MRSKVLEFKTILGCLPSPYLKSDVFFAKFGSKDVLDFLNLTDSRVFYCNLKWDVCFGKKIADDKPIPKILLDKLPPITTQTVKELKKLWNQSIKLNEPEEERFEIIDRFIQIHCISKLQIQKYYADKESGLI